MSARSYEDVINTAFDQWDQYATQVAAESAHGITFAVFVRERLAAAGYKILSEQMLSDAMLASNEANNAWPKSPSGFLRAAFRAAEPTEK